MYELEKTLVNLEKIKSKAEINKKSEVRMCVSPIKGDVLMNCHLKFLNNGYLIECNVKEIGAGEYCIQYTPTIRGRHELSISVDGQPVAGSPFPVLVCSPPTLLDKPVKVWDGVKMPWDVTINSLGEIIVVECADIVVMDKNGTRLRTINSSEYQLRNVQGIAVDGEDNIYFIDEGTNRIFKSNKNCSKVEVHRVQQIESPGHIAVAVVGDEVMVTECNNYGVIMVYDRELKYLRQIVGVNNNTMYGLCPDSHHNVYVCDCENSSIQFYSKDGKLLHSFGRDENGVKRMIWPWGVCVAGQYVYVTDIGACKIVVFTIEGDSVTSFGSCCSSYGVCVDQDGFVYVTDCNHSRISIY